ncbi:uncharacterized protein LOC105844812 isoform X3 [Hydra vulgaris]|uniref:uncharacterized protein LOC105844812 isoform X3 n=1 Tax=Hydra vulgaris TaxID=6087 RepID=UPI0032E9E2EB
MSNDILTSARFISKCCDEISSKIGGDWIRLGKHLDLSNTDLDNINVNCRNCYEKADNVLKISRQINGDLSWEHLKKVLEAIERCDIVVEIERKFEDYLLSLENISATEHRIPHGCVFKFDLQEDVCKVEFQLYSDSNNWKVINKKEKNYVLNYLTQKKNRTLFVKVENLLYENEKINFKFLLQDSEGKKSQHYRSVVITGICYYELCYNGLFIATPAPIFNNEFSKYIKTIESVDWRKINKIRLDKVPDDKPIELIASDYFNRNFPDWNDVIYVTPSIANNDILDFVVSKFNGLFTVNHTGLRAVFPSYHLRYHASLLNCNVENFTKYDDENRITIFFCKFNLVIIARVATSTECIKLEYERCLNDIILFVNVNNPVIGSNKVIILGIVVLPLHDRKLLKEELFFHFSEKFNLDQILFLCKDDFEDESFESWWRSVVEYCIKIVNPQNNEVLFKKLISLTMVLMAKVDHCYPTLESDTQKQIQTLLLNVEQRNAINDKALKKIITGGYGSGKSIVGKEIVKNCITQSSENSFTLYYICCNHFSLYECHMKEFVGSIEKMFFKCSSNVIVVCDNLFNLWKSMCQSKNISNMYISLPKLLEHLASINSNKVCFVFDELSEEYVKEEDATQMKHLFASILKDSLVVFIPESVTKNRELVTNKQKRTLQRNFFQEELIGMKVISLNKSMRVTECNKLLIDIAQKTIYETKSVLNIPKQNLKTLQENKKNSFESEDLQIKNDSKINSVKNRGKNDKKINDTIKVDKDNNYAFIKIEKGNGGSSNVTNETVDNYSGSISDQSSDYKLFDTNVTDFFDIDKDFIVNILPTSKFNIDPNNYMETEYVFKSGVIGHSIKGEKPKVVYLPFYDIKNEKSVKILSIILEKLCLNVLRKTVVICNNIEEVQSAAYAINNVKNFKAVTYSPHLQKYSPLLETKFKIKEMLRNDMDILVTDCKGFSGAESQSVIVFVSPEEIYLRHVLVDAISRSNSHLTVLVKKYQDNKKPLNDNKGISDKFKKLKDKVYRFLIKKSDEELLKNEKTIGNVLTNWSDENVVEKIIITSSNKKNRKSKDVYLVINENCKAFIDRGSNQDFEKYKENLQFQIFHENNFIYETMAFNLSNQVKQEFKLVNHGDETQSSSSDTATTAVTLGTTTNALTSGTSAITSSSGTTTIALTSGITTIASPSDTTTTALTSDTTTIALSGTAATDLSWSSYRTYRSQHPGPLSERDYEKWCSNNGIDEPSFKWMTHPYGGAMRHQVKSSSKVVFNTFNR